jgi:hypothetical protein
MNATLTHNHLFYLEKTKNIISLFYISCEENKCWKNFKIIENSLFNYSFYSRPEIENFRCDNSQDFNSNLEKYLNMAFEQMNSRDTPFNFLSIAALVSWCTFTGKHYYFYIWLK